MFCAKCRYINGDKAADRVSVNYSYDGNGNLIGREEKINGVQENSRTYLLDYTSDNPEILEEALSETSGVRYVYGADNERIYATVNSGDISETYTLNTDVRGSTRWATDSKGNIVANTTYDSYGNVTENKKLSLAEGDYDITTNYTHHTYDDIMETYNAGARTYMPKQARFLQKDPVAGVTTEPQTLNNYVYCLDNLVNYTDPDGCFAVPNIGAGISSAVKSAGNAIGNYATSAGSKLGKIAATARENAAGTFASVVCNTAKGIAWTLDKAMKVGAYIDKMPFAAKVAIGTAGFAIAVGAGAVSLPTAAVIAFSSLAGGATAGAIEYAINSAVTHEWNNKDFVHSVVNGALTNYMLAGATTGVSGIVNAVKSGKVTRFLGDETGSVGVKNGGDNNVYYHVTTEKNAQKIIETSELRHGKYETRVFAWTKQPTRKQASIAGISSDAKTVLKFRSNASFELDKGNLKKSIQNIVVQTTDGQKVPISIRDIESVGFKKEWWQFWKK